MNQRHQIHTRWHHLLRPGCALKSDSHIFEPYKVLQHLCQCQRRPSRTSNPHGRLSRPTNENENEKVYRGLRSVRAVLRVPEEEQGQPPIPPSLLKHLLKSIQRVIDGSIADLKQKKMRISIIFSFDCKTRGCETIPS